MKLAAIIDILRSLSDNWALLIGLVLALTLAGRIGKLRPYALGLRFPAILLLFRKVAFFVPFSGTMSSADQVAFWSLGAYLYFLIILGAHIGAVWALVSFYRRGSGYSDGGEIFGAAFWIYVGLVVGSALCVPVEGWCHFYIPAICAVGALKVLIVTPMLLPLAWIGLVVQLGLCFTRRAVMLRQFNKLLLVLIGCMAILQVVALPISSATSPVLHEARSSWQTNNPPRGQSGPSSETADFLVTWLRKLPEINALGVNVVEKQIPSGYENKPAARIMARAAGRWPTLKAPKMPWAVPIAVGVLILLMILAESVPLREERLVDAQPARRR